jgi:acetyl esterase
MLSAQTRWFHECWWTLPMDCDRFAGQRAFVAQWWARKSTAPPPNEEPDVSPNSAFRRLSLLILLVTIWCGTSPTLAARKQGARKQGLSLKITGAQEEVYKTTGGVKLRLWLFTPKGHKPSDKRPGAVFFFGGGWTGGTPLQFEPHARYLASRGMVAAIADYRVKGRQGTSPFECVKDGKSAVRWLRTHAARLGIDPKRIAAGGGSAGGHVAAATGTLSGLDEPSEDAKISSKPNALLLFNPVFDNGPKGYGHRRVKARWKEISPLHNLRKGVPPTIVFLGDRDRLIPVKTAETYKKKTEAVGGRCDLHVYAGQSHGFFNKRNAPMYAKTVREMDKFLASLGWLTGDPTVSP